ncbi:MAG: CRTAC1 family protein [Candidatus Manganitrophaceae bacterium]
MRDVYRVLLCGFLLVSCSGSGEGGGAPLDPPQGTDPLFEEVSHAAGINKNGRATYGNPIWGDFNRDGNLDLFVSGHENSPFLFRNNADGTFTDLTAESGIEMEGDKHGTAWGDYDGDGDLDLFITVGAAGGGAVGMKRDLLYRNDGNGHLTDVTDLAGVRNAFGRGRSVNWVDYDKDGRLDLFLKNASTPNVLYRNNGDGTFTNMALSAGIENAPGEISSWTDYDKDGDIDLFITSAAMDQLWRNNGDGTFMEATSSAGLKALDHGQGVAWGDYNNDGHLDLFISRGYSDVRDSFSWDASTITFSDIDSGDQEKGLDFVTSGDEATFDLYLGNILSVPNCRYPDKVFLGGQKASPSLIPFTVRASDVSGKPVFAPRRDIGFFIWRDDDGWHLRWSGNRYFYGSIKSNGDFTSVKSLNFTRFTRTVTSTLYQNNGDGTFTDVTEAVGVANQSNNRGTVWGDYDNDGDLDLYMVNSGNFLENGPNFLYRNNGDGTFSEIAAQGGVEGNVDGRGDGAAAADFNNDGFLDLYVTNGWGRPVPPQTTASDCLSFGPHLLYKNSGNDNKWLKMDLVGTVTNKDGIGAKVTLQADGRTQYREVSGGGQRFSQGSGPIHFGLGQASTVDAISIEWPSGQRQILTGISVNQHIKVVEP